MIDQKRLLREFSSASRGHSRRWRQVRMILTRPFTFDHIGTTSPSPSASFFWFPSKVRKCVAFSFKALATCRMSNPRCPSAKVRRDERRLASSRTSARFDVATIKRPWATAASKPDQYRAADPTGIAWRNSENRRAFPNSKWVRLFKCSALVFCDAHATALGLWASFP